MATSKSPTTNVNDLIKNNSDSQNINIFDSNQKISKIKELAKTKGKYQKFVVPKIEPSKIYNPDIDAEIDHIGVSHFGFIYMNLIKETYETLGLDYGETKNEIEYVNRLIDNPLEFNLGGMGCDGSFFYGDGAVPPPTGALPFVGKSRAQKMAMCGITSNSMGIEYGDNAGDAIRNKGMLRSVSLPMTGGSHSFEVNTSAAADLVSICKEILALGFFNLRISNVWRRQNSLTPPKVSRHCWGIALDINPTTGCPWFAAHIQRGFKEPAPGTLPPWKFKKYSCGGYDRSRCIWSYDHPVVRIFENHGWGWGGSYGDTMHFSVLDGN